MRFLNVLNRLYLGIWEFFLSRFYSFWELHNNTWDIMNIWKLFNINFWNSSALTVLSLDSCLQSRFVTKRTRKKHRLPFCGISFNANFISSHKTIPDVSCLYFIYPFTLVLFCSVGFETPNLTQSSHKIHTVQT